MNDYNKDKTDPFDSPKGPPKSVSSHNESTIGETRVGHYVIEGRLGKGGMGEVFLGLDEALKRKVAIKVLPGNYATNKVFVQRFNREAQAAASLNHPNIISVFYFGEHEGRLFFAMEYVEGRSLDEIVKHDGPVEPAKALGLIIQAAVALRYAASHGVTHRDIKPSNLLVAKDGTLKLADFGLAKSADVDCSLTRPGAVIGSPWFMSSEQAQGKETDFRTDIYSLGCTFYYLLNGNPPFDADTPVAIMVKHVEEPLPIPLELNALLDGELIAVLKKMTAKNPGDRYENYDKLLEDLRWLKEELDKEAVHAKSDFTDRILDETGPIPIRRKQKSIIPFIIGMLLLIIVVSGAVAIFLDATGVWRLPPQIRAAFPFMEQAPKIEFGEHPVIIVPEDLSSSNDNLADPPSPDEFHSWLRDMERRHVDLPTAIDEYDFRKATIIFNEHAFGPENKASHGVYRRLLYIFEHMRDLKLDLVYEVNKQLPVQAETNNGTIKIAGARENSLTIAGKNGKQQTLGWNKETISPPRMVALSNQLFGKERDALSDVRVYLFSVIYRVPDQGRLISDFERTYGKTPNEWLTENKDVKWQNRRDEPESDETARSTRE